MRLIASLPFSGGTQHGSGSSEQPEDTNLYARKSTEMIVSVEDWEELVVVLWAEVDVAESEEEVAVGVVESVVDVEVVVG